jgi:quercetin dioxygenase-like cupin family protein
MEAHLLDNLIAFSPESHTKRIFFDSGPVKAQVMGFEPGQQIPPCRMEHDVIFVVLEGQGEIIIDEEKRTIAKSSWVFIPKEKETRSLKAKTRMAVLAIQLRG